MLRKMKTGFNTGNPGRVCQRISPCIRRNFAVRPGRFDGERRFTGKH